MVASETSNCPESTALRTACAGVESGRRRRLTSVFVSTTMRCLVLIGEQPVEDVRIHAAFRSLRCNSIAETLKFRCVQVAQTLIFLRRKKDGHIALVAANHDRLTLRRVQQRC